MRGVSDNFLLVVPVLGGLHHHNTVVIKPLDDILVYNVLTVSTLNDEAHNSQIHSERNFSTLMRQSSFSGGHGIPPTRDSSQTG